MATRTLFDAEALPQLDALQNFALKLCRDVQFSRDLVQETLLKAYTYLHTYREGTNCRAWLFQICKNSYLNDVKRKRHQPIPIDFQEEDSWETHHSFDESSDVRTLSNDQRSERLHTDVLGDEVASAFESLSPDYQTVLILCDIEGYTYDEIADFLQAPIGTIRSRIHRGRKILADQLGTYALNHRLVAGFSSGNN